MTIKDFIKVIQAAYEGLPIQSYRPDEERWEDYNAHEVIRDISLRIKPAQRVIWATVTHSGKLTGHVFSVKENAEQSSILPPVRFVEDVRA